MDGLAVLILVLADPSVELDVDGDVVAWELPGVEIEPVVWNLDLVPVDDLLLEDAVAVAQAVAPGRVIERGQAVEEAGSQTTEASIAQGSVVLLFDDVLDAEPEIAQPI